MEGVIVVWQLDTGKRSYLLLPQTRVEEMCMDLIALMALLLYQRKVTVYSSAVCLKTPRFQRCKFLRGTFSLLMIITKNEHQENMPLVEVASTDVQKLVSPTWTLCQVSRNHVPGAGSKRQW